MLCTHRSSALQTSVPQARAERAAGTSSRSFVRETKHPDKATSSETTRTPFFSTESPPRSTADRAITAVSLPARCGLLRLPAPIGRERPPDVVLRVREMALRVATDEAGVLRVRLDELALARH